MCYNLTRNKLSNLWFTKLIEHEKQLSGHAFRVPPMVNEIHFIGNYRAEYKCLAQRLCVSAKKLNVAGDVELNPGPNRGRDPAASGPETK